MDNNTPKSSTRSVKIEMRDAPQPNTPRIQPGAVVASPSREKQPPDGVVTTRSPILDDGAAELAVASTLIHAIETTQEARAQQLDRIAKNLTKNEFEESANLLATNIASSISQVLSEIDIIVDELLKVFPQPSPQSHQAIIDIDNCQLPTLTLARLRSRLDRLPPIKPLGSLPVKEGAVAQALQNDIIYGAVQPISKYISNIADCIERALACPDFDPQPVLFRLSQVFPYVHLDPRIFSLFADMYEAHGDYNNAISFIAHYITFDEDSRPMSSVIQPQMCLVAALNSLPPIMIDLAVRPDYAKAGNFEHAYGLPDFKMQIGTSLVLTQIMERSMTWDNAGFLFGDRSESNMNPSNLYRMQPHKPYAIEATESILPGTDIEWDIPIAIVPMNLGAPTLSSGDDLGNWCIHCCSAKTFVKSLVETVGCPVMPHTCPFQFCSTSCFMRYGQLHQYECSFIHTQLFPLSHETGFTASFILLVIRVLLRSWIMRTGINANKTYNCHSLPRNDPLVKIAKFKSYLTETQRMRSELWKAIAALSRAIVHFVPITNQLGLSTSDLDEIICKIHTFSVQVTSFGNYLPTSSMPNSLTCLIMSEVLSDIPHSCVPNVYPRYDSQSGSVTLRSIALIQPKEILTVSYLADLFLPSHLRKTLTSSFRVICCNCARCLDPTEGKRFVSAWRCRRCLLGFASRRRSQRIDLIMKTDLLLYSKKNVGNDLQEIIEWECTRCGCYVDAALEQQEIEVNSVLMHIQALISSEPVCNIVKIRLHYEHLYGQLVPACHPNHYLLNLVQTKLIGTYRVEPRVDMQRLFVLQIQALATASVVLDSNDPTIIYHCFSLALASRTQKPDPVYLVSALWISYKFFGLDHIIHKHLLNQARLLSLASRKEFIPNLFIRGRLYEPSPIEVDYLRSLARASYPHSSHSDDDIHFVVNSAPARLLFKACRSGSASAVRNFVNRLTPDEAEYWLNVIDSFTGHTSLGVAAQNGHEFIFKILLDQASIFSLLFRTELGVTLLILIASSRPVAKWTVAEQRAQDETNSLMIMGLIKELKKKYSQVQRLNDENMFLKKTQAQLSLQDFICQYVNEKTSDYLGGQTAIHYAASLGKVKCIQFLLRNNSLVDSLNMELATPLHLAALTDHELAVSLLIDNHAQLNAPNFRGETPLMLACYGLAISCVRRLITSGARIDSVSDSTGVTCLHAVCAGLTNTFKLMFGTYNDKTNPLNIQIGGYSTSTIHHLYEPNIYYQESTVPSMPYIQNESMDLLSFPDEFARRIFAAEEIVMSIRQHLYNTGGNTVPESIFTHSSVEGFTAAEFLLHQWSVLQELRDNMIMDTRWAALSTESQEVYIKSYLNDVSMKIYKLANLLKPVTEQQPVSLNLKTLTLLGERAVLDKNTNYDQNELDIALSRAAYDTPKRLMRCDDDIVDEQNEELLRIAAFEHDKHLRQLEEDETNARARAKKRLGATIIVDGKKIITTDDNKSHHLDT